MKQTTKTVTRIFQARVPSHALQALQLQSSHRLVTNYLLVTLDSLLTLDIQRFPRIITPWPELVLHETILNLILSHQILQKEKQFRTRPKLNQKLWQYQGTSTVVDEFGLPELLDPVSSKLLDCLDFIFSTDCLHCLAFLSFCCSTPLLRLTFSGLGSTTNVQRVEGVITIISSNHCADEGRWAANDGFENFELRC